MRSFVYVVPVALVLGLGVSAPSQAQPLQQAQSLQDAQSLVADGSASQRASDSADLLARSKPAPRADRTLLTFFAGLPRDRQKMQAAATKASTPGLLEYRDFMALKDAAKKYGATTAAVTALTAAAQKAGVTVSMDRSGLFARLTAPATTWSKLYGKQAQVAEPTAGSPYRSYVFANGKQFAGAPKVFAGVTQEWVAVYSAYAPVHDIRGIDPAQKQDMQQLLDSTGSPTAWPKNTGTLPADTCGQQALTSKAVYAPSQIRKAYGSSALADLGMTGKDARMSIISMGGGFAIADIEAAAHCFGYTQPAIEVIRGTGVGQNFRNASVESHLDLITASAVIPAASTIKFLEVVDPETGFTDGLARALDYDGKGTVAPDVISASYGICEDQYALNFGPYVDLNQDLLKMAAIIGSSVLFAAGDQGSALCGAGATAPSVWYPASSPWVTAVGGTRLALGAANTRTSETAWNDAAFGATGAAGGGGPSNLFGHPWYQPALTSWSPRTVPDLAALGDIRPGWPVYYGGTLFTVGGTSGATPFLAANFALMSTAERAKGYPTLGFLNGWLYGASAKVRNFFDITVGGNETQPTSCCSAYAGYDMASGLGVPVLDQLQKAIVPPAG